MCLSVSGSVHLLRPVLWCDSLYSLNTVNNVQLTDIVRSSTVYAFVFGTK